MWGRGIFLVSFALIALGTAKCPKRKMSPVKEILCYTSTFDAQLLAGSACDCTTLVHQNHDVWNLSISNISDLRKSLKEMHPSLQFVISIHDPAVTLRNSAMVRQEAIARIIAIMKEVDGVEINMTAGSKERLYNFVKSFKDEMIRKSYDKRIFMALPVKSENLAKQFDIKELIKYIDLFTLPTDYMTDEDGAFVTFHPSRLMGLFDMLNADSLIDLISGLGAPKQKILMTLPVDAYKFTLKNEDENAPRSETTQKEPVSIDRKQFCEAINSGEWTVERDEDLTAPYAFQNKTWIAFEDKISVGIKGKYALLRDLAGLAVRNVENDVETECEVPLTQEIYHSFTEFRRKSRQAVLNALEDDLHQMRFSYVPNHAKMSSFRVNRVVDTEGHIRAVRQNTQTEFICRRQGYFVHPKSCNRFYRCVKFNQAIEDYSVFEFDCPTGLSFDERTEVCVWPGSLPEGSPCPGSSEIAPVAPKRFECSQPGYYADTQNCRWFFACMDLGGEELMAFEFRCPYGLVFDEKKLVCEWPWLVPACSEFGSGYTRTEYNYGSYTAGVSTGIELDGTSGLPEYSVTARMDYSNVDNSRTTSTGTNFFGSTAGNIDKYPGISVFGAGHVELSGLGDTESTKYRGAVSSVPMYSESPGMQIGSIPPNTIVVGEGGTGYSTMSSKIGDTGYIVSTGQDGTGYSVSTDGFNIGFANTESLGGVTAGFSGSTAKEYFGTANESHLKEQGITYSEKPISSYPSSAAAGVNTNYSKTSESYFRSTGLPKVSIDFHVGSTSSKYVGTTNVYSNTLNANNYSASTDVYSEATGHQPSFGKTGPSFGSVPYPDAISTSDFTGSTNREYTQSTATYGESIGTGYSRTTGVISAGSTENDINLSINSEIGSNPYSIMSSGRVPDFSSGIPKSELETSGISTVSGPVSVKPTGASSISYRYNKEGYTIPVFIQHEKPSIGITEIGTKGHIGTIGTSGVGLTNGYGTVFSHGNIPGAVSTPAINEDTILSGRVHPGYVTTSSRTPEYSIRDRVKIGDVKTVSPGTPIYGMPSTAISINGPSIAGILYQHSKGDSTPNVVISGQTIPEVSTEGSVQPCSTTESSIYKSYKSQSTYNSDSARGSTTYASSIPSEGMISTPQGYRTDEGHSTVTFNTAYDTSKNAEIDIPGYRPTNAILTNSIVFGGKVENTGSDIFSSTFEDSTTLRYSSNKSAVFTPSEFTKTGPNRSGITTTILGDEGSFLVSMSDHQSTYSPDNINEKVFEENIAGYTKTSSIDDLSVTLTPPGYSSTAAPGDHVTVQSIISGYSYPKPTVQFGTSATLSSTPVVPIGNNLPTSKPFFSRLPTSTVRPETYTEHPEIYKTTPFESFKIPIVVPTVKSAIDYIDTGYNTVSSPTTILVSTGDRFIQKTNGPQTASISTSSNGLVVPSQRTDSSSPTSYGSSLGYLSAKTTEAGVTTSTTKYDLSAQPELIGITYKKPSPISDATYRGPFMFQSPTTFRSSYSSQEFSTTPSFLGTTPSDSSPMNLYISRDKINKLITNYDRGTIKYTPTVYDTYSSSELGSIKKFTSSFFTKPSFSEKIDSDFAVTTPSGIHPSTFSYEVTTKSSEDKGKIIVKWSDLHPLLLGKLGAECTCKADPFANLRGPGKKLIDSSKGKVDLTHYDSSEIYVDLGYSEEDDYSANYDIFPAQPFKISAALPYEMMTVSTNLPLSSYLPVIDAGTSVRNNELHSDRRMGKKLEYEEKEEEEKEEYEDDDPDQIINGVTDCARPGLFRHPGLCNKFYACHWDQWKKKFTLHIFNCPVHLTFDSSAGACNWPSKGPACQANNLLV